jgi:hypothetical protein
MGKKEEEGKSGAKKKEGREKESLQPGERNDDCPVESRLEGEGVVAVLAEGL